MTYELMNKDKIMALIEVTDNFASVIKICDTIPSYIGNVQSWLNSRTSPMGRENIHILLKLAEIDTKQEYLKVTYGISLNDTFWLREVGNTMTWDRISPYSNRLSRIVSEVALNCNYVGGNIKSPSPDYTVDGSTDKCWVREQGRILLYKTNGEKFSGITGNRPYCEYYASQVANALISDKRHFISYGIKVSKTRQGYNKAYCYCPVFTTEKYGYLSYGDSPFRSYRLDELDRLLTSKRDREIIREMLLLDSVILNYDRHNGNYGFLVNNDNYKIAGVTPIFDQDCSFGQFVSLQSVDSMQEAYDAALQRQPRTEMGGYVDQARWALTNELKNNLINMYPFHFKRIGQDRDLEPNRLNFMEYIVNNQIRAILGK